MTDEGLAAISDCDPTSQLAREIVLGIQDKMEGQLFSRRICAPQNGAVKKVELKCSTFHSPFFRLWSYLNRCG